MKVLNATTRSISIMMDRGNILNIKPGTISEHFVASRNVILCAINSGSADEIGIILGGTYEQSIAQSVSGGQPYYYLSEDEAKARLLDPTVDYSATMKSTQTDDLKSEVKKLMDTVKDLETTIEAKDAEINELRVKVADVSSNQFQDMKIKELSKKNEELEIAVKKLTTELDGVNSVNTELRNQHDTLVTEKSAMTERMQILTKDNQTLNTDCNNLVTENEQLKKKVAELKNGLDEATKQIESMKTTFNGVCDEFGIQYTEYGKWIQVTK